MYHWVALAVNNPDNGRDTGRADAVRVGGAPGYGDTILALEGAPRVCRLLDGGKLLKFGRFRVPVYGYIQWFGNWCWDAVLLEGRDVTRIIAYARGSGWRCDEGEAELFRKFRDGEVITVEDLERAVRGEEVLV